MERDELSRNPHSKYVFEKMGVTPIRTTESNFKTFMKSFKEAMGDIDISDEVQDKLRKHFAETENLEEEVVYEYKLVS